MRFLSALERNSNRTSSFEQRNGFHHGSESESLPEGMDRKVGQKKRIPFNPTFVSGKERVYLTPIRKGRTGLVESRIRSVGSGN